MFERARLILLLLLISLSCLGQLTQADRKLLKTANNYFDNEEFDKALPIFIKLNEVVDDYNIKYRIGACYLNTPYDKLKALPYLEEVSKVKNIQIPIAVYFDLGTIYHFMYQFEKAIGYFKTYIDLGRKDDFADASSLAQASRMIEVCRNAINITTQPFNVEIKLLPSNINTMESEYCPMISADEKVLVYMQTIGLINDESAKTQLLISYQNADGLFTEPQVLKVEHPEKFKGQPILLAGLSNDGRTIFLNIGKDNDTDIYVGTIENNTIVQLKKLNKYINSDYYEGGVSLSYDGTELYFVSNRPGGFGGTDIYKSKLGRKGDWSQPVNLGPAINTKYSESSPFMHPDNQTLYFSSEGHKTIGGNDIFYSKFTKDEWSEPKNMGFPNSTKDDLYFVLSANGQTGYFSSSKNNVYDKHNIFKVNFKDPIPLTLVKGTIKAGSPPKPIEATIRVYDNETKLPVKYVYSPDPLSGNYLLIFPPAKNYDIIVTAKKFLPQHINVHIPYQTYFYELFQEITLDVITVNNKVIGEKVVVNNMFYDMYKTAAADSIIQNVPKNPLYYDHLLELVETIIQTTDSLKLSYPDITASNREKDQGIDKLLSMVEEAFETTNPVTLKILDANAAQKDKVNQTHFYNNGDKNQSRQMVVFGFDTLYTAPTVYSNKYGSQSELDISAEFKRKANEVINFKGSDPEKRRYIHQFTIYYDLNQFDIKASDKQQLNQIAQILLDNPLLGAEIYGFADAVGEPEYNLDLSKKRAQSVLSYLLNQKVPSRKFIAKGYGEVSDFKNKTENKLYRKVEIRVFEINE
jgi:outer membrane protein OmpA-like peptidoglycan-associated protein/Tol biopolymer transport system component